MKASDGDLSSRGAFQAFGELDIRASAMRELLL